MLKLLLIKFIANDRIDKQIILKELQRRIDEIKIKMRDGIFKYNNDGDMLKMLNAYIFRKNKSKNSFLPPYIYIYNN